jgi:predicted amidohydrolase YtcJ
MLTSSCSTKEQADLVLYNAKIYTLDDNRPLAESFAVKKGKIAAIGSNKEILDRFISDQMIDTDHKIVMPGFIDGHCHFHSYGIKMLYLADLSGTSSLKEILDILKRHMETYPSEWILGRGWDQNDWEIRQFPDNKVLDSVFTQNPVLITRIDGHAALANSLALKKAGISADTKIEGGLIEVRNGMPTGILIDNAIDLVNNIIPVPDRSEEINALIRAQNDCFRYGITMVVDAGLSNRIINLIDTLQNIGVLSIRIDAMMTPTEDNFKQFLDKGVFKTNFLHIGSVKLYSDGALGSRGAALLEPYSDDQDNYGMMIYKPDYYKTLCQRAYNANFQVNTHAIGDSAVRFILHTYAGILKGPNDRRWRIEHAQVVDLEDLKLFGQYNIIPSIQATHATSDMYWAEDRLGHGRIKEAYAYKDLLTQNGWLINGTDFPNENMNPLFTFYAAVARKDLKGYPEGGFQTENAMTREEALQSMTIWAAKGSFWDKEIGSLEIDKFADFIILDKDIMTIPESEIPFAMVLNTYINGKEVFKADVAR